MDSNDLDAVANNLRIYLLSLADSADHVSVGVGKNALHVYTKRRFQFSVPKYWEGVTIIHHKKAGKVMPYTKTSYINA